MKSALAAMLFVVIAIAAVPRPDLPPAVQAAKNHVDAALDEARPTAERVIRRAQRAFRAASVKRRSQPGPTS